MSEFAERHRPGDPLFLPNAWDFASAAALARAGFDAVGTTSLGVAASHGLPDGRGLARAVTVALARRLSRIPVMVSVDIEAGFSDDAGEVAELAAELFDAGVVGINLEDGRPDGSLAPLPAQQAKIAAVVTRVPSLFVNARTDTHWPAPSGDLTETLARANAYRDAGAHGIFVPGLVAPDDIARVAEVGPLNVLLQPGRVSFADAAAAGAARVSCGSLLFRAALGAAVATALEAAGAAAGRVGRGAATTAGVNSGDDWAAGCPTYDQTDALANRWG